MRAGIEFTSIVRRTVEIPTPNRSAMLEFFFPSLCSTIIVHLSNLFSRCDSWTNGGVRGRAASAAAARASISSVLNHMQIVLFVLVHCITMYACLNGVSPKYLNIWSESVTYFDDPCIIVIVFEPRIRACTQLT
jgi:hypothetical protein